MNVAFLVEMHKYTSVMRRRSEPPKRKIAQRKAFYYLRSTDRGAGFPQFPAAYGASGGTEPGTAGDDTHGDP